MAGKSCTDAPKFQDYFKSKGNRQRAAARTEFNISEVFVLIRKKKCVLDEVDPRKLACCGQT